MEKVRVSMTGDVLLHGSVLRKAKTSTGYDFDRMFENAEGLFYSSDLVIVNQESIVAGEDFEISSFPKFNSPKEVLATLKSSGVNVLNIANNHVLDRGEPGLTASIHNIRDVGLDYCGAYLDDDDDYVSKIYDVKGVRVALVSYADASKLKTSLIDRSIVNCFKGESHAMRMNVRLSKVKKSVKHARDNADVVILSLHFGEEYHRYPNSFQREVVATLAETDVDIIVGHHPHVLQPIETIMNSKGKKIPVAYSLGNFFSGQVGIFRQLGGVLNFSVGKKVVKDVEKTFVSDLSFDLTYVDIADGYKIKPLANAADAGLSLKAGKGVAFESSDLYQEMQSHMNTLGSSLSVQ